ncbi:MAG TPA: hypothetical protein VES39_00910 [Rhodospirillales bacterium]|nr:hypothetical protein [Rhodospirillales bacterium]
MRQTPRKVIAPHERQDPPPPPLARCRSCLINYLPVTVLVLVLAGIVVWVLTGCAARQEAGYTTRDEMRVACGTAAQAYAVAIERTRAGDMAPATFRALDDGYAGVVATCRRVLADGAPAGPGDAARVAAWTAQAEAIP